MKTLNYVKKQDKEKFKIPKSIQETIPIQTIWKDGIFLVGRNKYSKSYEFFDINFAIASREEKHSMLLKYCELINSIDSETTAKFTINMRYIDKDQFEQDVLLQKAGGQLDEYKDEYNKVLLKHLELCNGMVKELYLTISTYKRNIHDARNYYDRIEKELRERFEDLDSGYEILNGEERLKILHDFYRFEKENHFFFDLNTSAKLGHDFKDYICPDGMEYKRDYFKMGERYGRVLFLKDYASFADVEMVGSFTDIHQNMMISIDVIPIPVDEAVREVENRLLGVETNIAQWQRRQNANQNFSAMIPYDMENQRTDAREFMDDLSKRDQNMTSSVLTLVHTAETKEQLDVDTDRLMALARGKRFQLGVLQFQQMDGLNTALPIGVRKIEALRTLTTESLSALVPFRAQEVMDKGGIYCGINAKTKNLILVNRENLMNPSAFVLGVPGSGKSMYAKLLILSIALRTEDQILVYDPEGEYSLLVEMLGGIVLPFVAGGNIHINAMDMVKGYAEKDPLAEKAQFVHSFFEQIAKGEEKIGRKEFSILDRCVEEMYEQHKSHGVAPTLRLLRELLLQQEEAEARPLALMLEQFTEGSLRFFSQPTNIDLSNRIICFNTRDMTSNMREVGQLIITDQMINQVANNWQQGKRTHIILDEFHTLLQKEYSAEFFNSAYRRFRKRNAWVTGLTQNVEYILDSITTKTMISNSELVVMLNQSSDDREKLAQMLHISDEQLKSITNVKAGNGLLRVGKSLIPFENQWPEDTKLYKLISTKSQDIQW